MLDTRTSQIGLTVVNKMTDDRRNLFSPCYSHLNAIIVANRLHITALHGHYEFSNKLSFLVINY